ASPLTKAWLDFFELSRQHSAKNGIVRKTEALAHRAGPIRRAAISVARRAVKAVRQAGLIPLVNGISPRFGRAYNKLIHSGSRGQAYDYSRLHAVYAALLEDYDSSEPLVIYAPMWKG